MLSNLTYGEDKQITGASGYYWEIFELLRAELNFTANIRYSVDGKFGSAGKDGETWNGMVGMLMRYYQVTQLIIGVRVSHAI